MAVKNCATLTKELAELQESVNKLKEVKGVDEPIIKFLNEVPERAYEGDAGFDLYTTSGGEIYSGGVRMFGTGLTVEIPKGYVGFIKGRSYYGSRKCLFFNGVIDSGYRGEIFVSMFNGDNVTRHIKKGTKIAQLVICKLLTNAQAVSYEELSESERGEKNCGSSNKK